MKRLTTLALLMSLLWATATWAGLPVFYQLVSSTDVATNVTITFVGPEDKAFTVLIINDGANEIFFELDGTTATTGDKRLNVGESITIHSEGGYDIRQVSIICSAAETATVRVLAFPTK